MCGRYILKITFDAERYFQAKWEGWQSSFNIAPTVDVPIVRLDQNGIRTGVVARWGLVPFFARGVPGKYTTHNARIETFQTNASYRGPWKRGQRCLQPASGFYEWQLQPDGKTKQPYLISIADRQQYAFAALWERSVSDDGSLAIESVTHITMPATPDSQIYRIHNTGNHPHRTPAILAQEDEEVWLHGTQEEALAVLRPYPDDITLSWPVSKRVGNSRNDDEALTNPIDVPPTGAQN